MKTDSTDTAALKVWPEAVFLERMRQAGQAGYYDRHPFHLLLDEGKLPLEMIRRWIRGRYYYQIKIPVKDAFIAYATRHGKSVKSGFIGSPIMMEMMLRGKRAGDPVPGCGLTWACRGRRRRILKRNPPPNRKPSCKLTKPS